MLLKVRGTPHHIFEPIVGRVTRDASLFNEREIFLADHDLTGAGNFKAFVTPLSIENLREQSSIYSVYTTDHLAEGDIVLINTDGVINTLYRVNSFQNFLLATERCNSNCLMCSQPPRDKNDIPFLYNVHKKLIPLIPKNCHELGITGGEPTLMGENFFKLLALIKEHLPDTEIHCLTNGRSFAWPKMAEKLASLELNRLMLGIPLYADYYQVHDYIVQARDAFMQTLKGLHNLALYDQRVEVRIVLHKQSVPRLRQFAKFLYKNLPFVEHVAFMGLEYQGYTPHNIEKLWIDPVNYMEELADAVYYLSDRGMNVSIYNSQLCVLPQYLWRFARKSISDWKNIYLEECSKCSIKERCGGLFASCNKMHSDYIKAFEGQLETSI